MTCRRDLKKLQQRKSGFGWLRFGSIAAIIIAFYILWSIGVWYVIIVSILLLVVFIRLLFADLKNKAAIEHTTHLINITNDELKFLDGNYQIFPGGNEHVPEDHLYANDLDIFGANFYFPIYQQNHFRNGKPAVGSVFTNTCCRRNYFTKANCVERTCNKN